MASPEHQFDPPLAAAHASSRLPASDKAAGWQVAVAAGRAVIRQEADALNQLSTVIDASFARAVDLLVETRGRVVVTGIGKSGHIARKVAATLAATGTPAFYLHPAEAAHGDLGMLKEVDTLLLFSNSGKTRELAPTVAHAGALGIPCITIASKPDTPLTRTATVNLLLPPVAEACPVKIAPTTSTTMMLALGDALALATMELRGTTKQDLQILHPGGDIGWRMLPVDQLMRGRDQLPLVREHARMRDVVLEMTTAGKGVAGVVDEDGFLIGIITDGDLRRSFDQIMIATARDVMTTDPITIPSGTTVEQAVATLSMAKITVMFVMDRAEPRRPVGLLHIHDLATGS